MAARGPPPRHRDHRRRAGNVDFYARAARPAAGQEDRQLRRARRLPPLLRRRDRHARLDPDLLRVPRRGAAAAPATGWSTDPLARRLDDALDFWASACARPASRRARRRARCRFADPEGLEHELVAVDVRRPAARAPRARHPAPSTRSRASTACARTRRARRSAALLEALGFAARGRRRAGEPPGAAPRLYATTPPPDARGIQGAGHGPPRRVERRRRRRAGALPRAACRAPARSRRRSSTASTSTRSTSASRAASCSSWPRRDIGFDVDEPVASARRGAEAAAAARAPARRSLEQTLTPLATRAAAVSATVDHESARPPARPQGALVLLHGRGADEHDLFAAARRLRPASGGCVGITPAARCRCRPAAGTGTSCRASAIRPADASCRPTSGSTAFLDACRSVGVRWSGPSSAASRRAA